MKIKPVAKAAPSPIPTAAEAAADPSLLAPAVRRGPRGAGALLGAGLLGGLFAPAAVGADGAAPPPEVPVLDASRAADAEAAARAEEAREAVATVVAPILQKALDEEGRGAYGCLVIDPPVFLTETEALNLIEQEFAKAGTPLLPAHVLGERALLPADRSGLTARDRKEIATEGQMRVTEWGDRHPHWADAPSWTSSGHKWIFDFATEDGSLLVEYLSESDQLRVEIEKTTHINPDGSITYECSSVSDCDFPQLAAELRERFVSRPSGTPATVALFFDPLVSHAIWDGRRQQHDPSPGSSIATLSEEERTSLDWNKKEELLRRDARELLREQVRFFLDWARKEGRLPVPKQQPSADESPMEPREQP